MTEDHILPGRRVVVAVSLLLAAAAAHAQARAAPSADGKAATAVVTELDGTRTLVQSIVVDAPAARVWHVLTTSEGWRSWAAPVAWVDFRLGGVIETSYQASAAPGNPANIKNQIVAYLPARMFAIRNIQAPPNTAFDAPTFQSLHTVVLVDTVTADRTRVTFAQPGYRSGEPFDTVLKHFSWGNGWTLEQLKKRFDEGPVDWAKRAAEAAARPSR
jgi:uncharacterized protein YndB with AHSA1/START domain